MNCHKIDPKMRARLAADIVKARGLAGKLGIDLVEWEGLLVTEDFRFFRETATCKQYKDICNGAGPKGAGLLVPDSMWGLNMTIVFDVHDRCYHIFKTADEKELSDLLMKINMILYINKHTTRCPMVRRFLINRREFRANIYYLGVILPPKEWFFN